MDSGNNLFWITIVIIIILFFFCICCYFISIPNAGTIIVASNNEDNNIITTNSSSQQNLVCTGPMPGQCQKDICNAQMRTYIFGGRTFGGGRSPEIPECNLCPPRGYDRDEFGNYIYIDGKWVACVGGDCYEKVKLL